MRAIDLHRVLTIKPDLRLEPTLKSQGILLGERQRFALSGKRIADVLALVDGRRTVQEIMEAARGRLSEPEVFYTLGQLEAGGTLVSAVLELPPASAAFWHGVGLDAQQAMTQLKQTPIAIHSLGDDAAAQCLSDALCQAGVQVDGSAQWRVVVTDHYLRPELLQFHRQSIEEGIPWCLVKPSGTTPLIGPLLKPRNGPCGECLAHWIRANHPVEEFLRRQRCESAPVSPPVANIEASLRTTCGLAALVIARSLAGATGPQSLEGQLLALDLASFQLARHAVVQRPQCPSCGDPKRMRSTGERPVVLEPVPKAFREDGGYRRESPAQTYARYRHLVSPITGAVTHLVPMVGRHNQLRSVYASGYLVCPREDALEGNPFDKGCAGKGRSPEQARVSALCEALERYSGVFQGDEACRRATLAELGDAAVPPDALLNFSDSQYENRTAYNARASDRSRRVPLRLNPDNAIDWTPGWSLSRQVRRYIPLPYCYDEAPAESGTLYCTPGYNGVAAGTCLEEAILQGLLELVERDATALWWYSRACRPAVNLDAFEDEFFDALSADYARAGWDLWVLDLTHDLGIPVCVALARERQTDGFALGFGCHLDPHLAVQRALTELNQLFNPTVEPQWKMTELPRREFLFPSAYARTQWGPPPSRRGKEPHLRADVEDCMRRLHRAGLELIVVDKTRPDIQLNVAQVIVPGLRHFWPRFGPGRLYTVPYQLGWIARPLAESELNPLPLFV